MSMNYKFLLYIHTNYTNIMNLLFGKNKYFIVLYLVKGNTQLLKLLFVLLYCIPNYIYILFYIRSFSIPTL